MAFIWLSIPPLLFMPPRLLVLLRWPYRPLSRLRSSLRLQVGFRLPPPTRLCLLRTCATPAWVRSPPSFRPLPDGPPLAFSSDYISLSNYLLFCISLRFRLALWSIVGPPLALPTVVGQPRALTLFFRPRLARTLLRWPSCCYAFIRWPSGSFGGSGASSGVGLCVGLSQWLFGAWMFGSPTCCHSLSCFPQVFVYRRRDVCSGCSFTSTFTTFIGCFALWGGGRCAVTDAPLPRRPRLCPSWRRLRPPPRCYYDRSLCFFWLIVLCVSQPKMSHWVVLYGHRKRRVPWISPEFILALSRTRSLSSDL